MKHGFRSAARWLGLLAAGLVLAACATAPSGPPEEVVAVRAKARWDALVAKRMGDAYQFLPPSTRAVTSESRYVARFGGPVEWLGAEVVSVTCADENSCAVKLEVRFRALMSKMPKLVVSSGVDETWIREDGRWWYYEK